VAVNGLALGSLTLLLAVRGAPPPVPTFRASIEAVYVDVFVTRGGEPVRSLTAADFEVRDNGVRQDVALVGLDEVPVVAVMVFDASASVAGARLQDLQAAGHALLAGLRPQDRAVLVTFSHELRVAASQGGDPGAVRRALDGVVPRGHTAVWDALYAGLNVRVGESRPMLVLFTDAEDNQSWLSADDVLKVARESDALVHVVAIVSPPAESSTVVPARAGLRVDRGAEDRPQLDALRKIAEATGGQLWPAGDSSQLERTFLRILAEMQSRYLLSYTPSGVAREGWHPLRVTVKGRKGIVRSRSGYFVPARPSAGGGGS
jgi:VWFA-related protein